MLRYSVRLNPEDGLPYMPFLFTPTSATDPMEVAELFVVKGILPPYGFSHDANAIHSEWLYCVDGSPETKLFERNGQVFDIDQARFPDGNGKGMPRPITRLFLSLIAQLNEHKDGRGVPSTAEFSAEPILASEDLQLENLQGRCGGLPKIYLSMTKRSFPTNTYRPHSGKDEASALLYPLRGQDRSQLHQIADGKRAMLRRCCRSCHKIWD